MNDKNGKVIRTGARVALIGAVLAVTAATAEEKDRDGKTTKAADPGSVTVQAKDGHTIVLPGDVLEVQDTDNQTTGGAAPTSRSGQPGSGVSGQSGTSAAEANGEPASGPGNRQMIPGSTGQDLGSASTNAASAGASTVGTGAEGTGSSSSATK